MNGLRISNLEGFPLKVFFRGILALTTLTALPALANPEGFLAMCQRDGRNLISRLERNSDGQRGVAAFAATCIDGPRAAEIKGIAGYDRVVASYEKAKSMVAQAAAAEAAAKEQADAATLAAGPGGDSKSVRERWSARPGRCQSPKAWAEAAGVAGAPTKTKARIAGLEEAGIAAAPNVHPRLFEGKSSAGRFPEDMTPDDHLARLLCGQEIEGIDPFFRERDDIWGSQFLDGDPRLVLGWSLDSASEPDRTLYSATLAHHCFGATQWDVKEDYLSFLFCDDALGSLPPVAEVSAAFDKRFPGRDYEKANLTYAYRRAFEAAAEIRAAFGQIEARYPRLKALFRTTAEKARARYAERRAKYAAYYEVLDPVTAAFLRNPASKTAPGCEAPLLALRAKLAQELGVKDEAGVEQLKSEHPVGFQITEALAYCYLGQGKRAKAWLETQSLGRNRRVTEAEEVTLSRWEALSAAQKELAGRIQEEVPCYGRHYNSPSPPSLWVTRKLIDLVAAAGPFELRGLDEQKPAVVASLKKTEDGGADLTFKKFSHQRKYRDQQCRETDRVQRFEFFGNGIRPVYQRECWLVGPVKTRRVTYQEEQAHLMPEDAALVEAGVQLTFVVNRSDATDSALSDLFPAKEGKAKARMLSGFRLKQ